MRKYIIIFLLALLAVGSNMIQQVTAQETPSNSRCASLGLGENCVIPVKSGDTVDSAAVNAVSFTAPAEWRCANTLSTQHFNQFYEDDYTSINWLRFQGWGNFTYLSDQSSSAAWPTDISSYDMIVLNIETGAWWEQVPADALAKLQTYVATPNKKLVVINEHRDFAGQYAAAYINGFFTSLGSSIRWDPSVGFAADPTHIVPGSPYTGSWIYVKRPGQTDSHAAIFAGGRYYSENQAPGISVMYSSWPGDAVMVDSNTIRAFGDGNLDDDGISIYGSIHPDMYEEFARLMACENFTGNPIGPQNTPTPTATLTGTPATATPTATSTSTRTPTLSPIGSTATATRAITPIGGTPTSTRTATPTSTQVVGTVTPTRTPVVGATSTPTRLPVVTPTATPVKGQQTYKINLALIVVPQGNLEPPPCQSLPIELMDNIGFNELKPLGLPNGYVFLDTSGCFYLQPGHSVEIVGSQDGGMTFVDDGYQINVNGFLNPLMDHSIGCGGKVVPLLPQTLVGTKVGNNTFTIKGRDICGDKFGGAGLWLRSVPIQ